MDYTAQTPDLSLLSAHAHPRSIASFDVSHALKVTTHAIHPVWSYWLSLPDEYSVNKSQPKLHNPMHENNPKHFQMRYSDKRDR